MNRRVLFLCSTAAVQALYFSALAPLLPSFERQLGLSKAQAGLLVAMFPVGQLVAGLPIGLLASRLSVRRLALGSLATMAAASAAFGFANSYGLLLVTRLLQGTAAAVCFASGLAWLLDQAPRERRGRLIGLFWGANAGGNLLGPAIGGVAVLSSRAGTFAGVAGLTLLLALAGLRSHGPVRREQHLLAAARAAHRSGAVSRSLGIVALSALLFGTIFLLAPLQLDRAGWGPIGIAGTFLAAAAVGVIARPLIGLWADRRGVPASLRLLLLAAVPVTLVIPLVHERWALSLCIVCAVATYGMLVGPAIALIAHAYDEAGVTPMPGFALMGITVGIGFFLGSAVGGEIAHLAGDLAAYSLAAGACLAVRVALVFRSQPALFAKRFSL
jgi:predicted MFS family arabinose efflux permease